MFSRKTALYLENRVCTLGFSKKFLRMLYWKTALLLMNLHFFTWAYLQRHPREVVENRAARLYGIGFATIIVAMQKDLL
jgi:hypothetical protein